MLSIISTFLNKLFLNVFACLRMFLVFFGAPLCCFIVLPLETMMQWLDSVGHVHPQWAKEVLLRSVE